MVWKKKLQNTFYQKIEPDEKQSRNINFISNGALAGEAGKANHDETPSQTKSKYEYTHSGRR